MSCLHYITIGTGSVSAFLVHRIVPHPCAKPYCSIKFQSVALSYGRTLLARMSLQSWRHTLASHHRACFQLYSQTPCCFDDRKTLVCAHAYTPEARSQRKDAVNNHKYSLKAKQPGPCKKPTFHFQLLTSYVLFMIYL